MRPQTMAESANGRSDEDGVILRQSEVRRSGKWSLVDDDGCACDCPSLRLSMLIEMHTDNPPPLPVTVAPLKERHFGVHQSPGRAPAPPPLTGHGTANIHHAMLSPPVAGQSTFHPAAAQPHQQQAQHMNRLQQQGENYYNVPMHQHTHGGIMGNELPPAVAMVPHAHFRHPADLSYSNAEMRQS